MGAEMAGQGKEPVYNVVQEYYKVANNKFYISVQFLNSIT